MDMTLKVENADKAGIQPNIVIKAVLKVFSGEAVKFSSITIVFVSDDEIREVNKKYLDHNFATDVVTFPLNDEQDSVEGEIYVSINTTKRNSKDFKVSHQNELLRVTIHGALHLAGYDDSTSKLKSEMKVKEDHYLDLVGEPLGGRVTTG